MSKHLPEIVLTALTTVSAVPVLLRPHTTALIFKPPPLAALLFALCGGAIYSSLAVSSPFFIRELNGSTGDDRGRRGNYF